MKSTLHFSLILVLAITNFSYAAIIHVPGDYTTIQAGIAESCIINCEGDGRGFYFHDEESAASVVDGFTIKNGFADYGGGIYCNNSSPTITNNIITNNSSDSHGSGTWWIAADIDDDDIGLAIQFCEPLEHLNVPCYIERSKSKGFHIWIFFSEPISAKLARAFRRGGCLAVSK